MNFEINRIDLLRLHRLILNSVLSSRFLDGFVSVLLSHGVSYLILILVLSFVFALITS